MLRSAILQPKALPALIAISTAALFSAGKAPGNPRQVGQTCVFGGAPNCVEQPQKIFVFVRSCAWTSRPITGSQSATARLHRPREAEQRLLVEGLADQLHADGQAFAEAGVDRNA